MTTSQFTLTDVVPHPETNEALHIKDGHCRVLFVYDVGLSINLDECERRITQMKQREKIRHRRRAPRYFEYKPLPLRITQQASAFSIAHFTSIPSVDLVLYDFGAVLVAYDLPIHGKLQDLLFLSQDLYDNESLLTDSRARVQQLVETLGDAVSSPLIAEAVEDYVIFQGKGFEPVDFTGLSSLDSRVVAQILRSEIDPLSPEEVEDASSCRISYGSSDVTIIDWNAAFVFDKDSDDVVAVLEYANVELLEMRHLDQQLDDALTQAYQLISPDSSRRSKTPKADDLARVAQLQVDSAMMFEGVNNALKLLGDQYLARVYQLASQRFHLTEWDASIMRKLATLESIYTKLSDRAATRRMEVLEWIIIILIMVSIILPFIPGMKQ